MRGDPGSASPSPRSFCAALLPHSGSADRSIALSLPAPRPFRYGYPFVLGSVTLCLSPSVNLCLVSCGNLAFVWVSLRGSENPSLHFPTPSRTAGLLPLSGRTCRLYGPATGPRQTPSSVNPDLSSRPALPRLSGARAHKVGPVPFFLPAGFLPSPLGFFLPWPGTQPPVDWAHLNPER